MELYEKSLRTIELPAVLELLAARAVPDGAKEAARNLRPSGDVRQVRERLAERDDIDREMIFISYGAPVEGCVDAERRGVEEFGPFRYCYETGIGSTISSHCGPGTIGVVIARKKA